MRVCISVNGRFHAFNLAQQLFKRGALSQIITSYPKFEVFKYGIPKGFVSSVLSNELLSRAWARLPNQLKNIWDPHFFLSERFDRIGAQRIKSGADIFVGWSGCSLKVMQKAKKLGMMTILERGSSHIIFQRNILQQECERYGIKADIPHPIIVDKELREYEEADYIEVPSSFAKRTFLEKGFPANKMILTPLGVSISEFYPVEKQDRIFRIIHCGAISIRKGVPYLLKAFYELNLPNSELWLIGSINRELDPFLKKYNHPKLYLKGKVRQSELYKLYSQGSLFCLASIEEGLAMTILQAMACALPVICAVNTGAEDVVREGVDGFVIPICDVPALKEKILFMYENQDKCEEMGKLARQKVQANFTWDAYGDRIISEYSKKTSFSC